MTLTEFNQQIGTVTKADQAWVLLQDFCRALVGAKLFTVMVLDEGRGLSSRVHTSHAKDYPVSGTKPINRTAWFDVVHGERKPFVANSIAAIADVFPDYAQIKALGCESVVNLPIILGNQMVGTVNMLDVENFYTEERMMLIENQLSLPAKLAFCVWQRSGGRI